VARSATSQRSHWLLRDPAGAKPRCGSRLACCLAYALLDLSTLSSTEQPEFELMNPPFHILHVEDDDLDALNVQRLLRRHDAITGIIVARDGIEALDFLRSGQADLRGLVILLDLCLPRMDGLEFLAELRADPALSHLPVVVLSTSNLEEDKAMAYRMNVAGYLVKPPDADRFARSLATFATYWSNSELL
jgi:CheY-like chemotaxis protein